MNAAGVDYVSTDLLAPDYRGQGTTRYRAEGVDFAKIASECERVGYVAFGGIYLELEWTGRATMTLGRRTFVLPQTDTVRRARYQPMLFDEVPCCTVTDASEDFRTGRIALRVVEF